MYFVPGIYSILILLAIFVACSYERLNLTVDFIVCSTGSGTYPESFIFSSTKLEYFLSYSKNTLFLLIYSSSYFWALALSVYTGSTSSSLSPYPALNRVRTPLMASFGSFLDFTAPIKSGKSRLFIFFTSLNKKYLTGWNSFAGTLWRC